MGNSVKQKRLKLVIQKNGFPCKANNLAVDGEFETHRSALS